MVPDRWTARPSGRVLAHPQVRARLIVVDRIQGQHLSQLLFAEDQDMIQALARSALPGVIPNSSCSSRGTGSRGDDAATCAAADRRYAMLQPRLGRKGTVGGPVAARTRLADRARRL